MNFEFDEANHIYSQSGRIIPGVTRVLDHSGLVDYSAVHEEILERKSDLGRVVHKATHYYDDGNLDWDTVDEQAKPRVEAWAEFRAVTGFVPFVREAREVVEVNGLKYGMQIDAAGILGKKDSIIDLKTGAFQWWNAVQVAAYAAGIGAWPGMLSPYYTTPLARFTCRQRYVCELRADGSYKLHGPLATRLACGISVFETFIWALGVTHVKMAMGNKILTEEDIERTTGRLGEGSRSAGASGTSV